MWILSLTFNSPLPSSTEPANRGKSIFNELRQVSSIGRCLLFRRSYDAEEIILFISSELSAII